MDIQLNNSSTVVGLYNNVETTIASNTVLTNMISGLTAVKSANKVNWTDGYLTYTITVSNQAQYSYVTPEVTDTIDATKVNFIDGSVTIDGVIATSEQYNYNTETHVLTINLTDIAPTTSKVITFQVEKTA